MSFQQVWLVEISQNVRYEGISCGTQREQAVPTQTAMHSYRELHVGGEGGQSNH